MLPGFPSDPLGTCWKISRSNFWKSSDKNLFHLNLRGFESRHRHLSFITYLLLIMTIVLIKPLFRNGHSMPHDGQFMHLPKYIFLYFVGRCWPQSDTPSPCRQLFWCIWQVNYLYFLKKVFIWDSDSCTYFTFHQFSIW